ncbi:MAG: hypothetical protein WCS42_13820 [Verrucomicrobiota bacterium]
MFPKSVINAVELQVSQHAVSVLRVRGNYRGATDAWLMFFNSNGTPADGAVPLVPAIPLPSASPFFAEFEIGALEFSLGCYACVSTTEDTKTISAETMDLSAELSDPENPTGVSYAGNLVDPVTGLPVWSEAAGVARKRLVALEVDGAYLTVVAVQFIQIFATDTVNAGDIPLLSLPIAGGFDRVVNAITVKCRRTLADGIHFGNAGREVFSIDSAAPFTKRLGCTIKISRTPNTYTACSGSALIKAEYITAL